ncbi:mechanosensitive ion channel [Alphaproteobacteria bacterium KMM 3653]|uniref:Mechanosensitive ion channel n=1 Tax=Harenicola maris TaxID=2841044 RepID=A0AAP2G8H3_9RHOB|nr:mechanosensitive ion channel [Harenicola maris]
MADDPSTKEQTAEQIADLTGQLTTLWGQAESLALSMVQPWRLYQLGIVVALFIVSHFAAKWLGPVFYSWVRRQEGWPKWRLRTAVVLHKRLRPIIFITLAWSLVFVMREVTWPSRSYVISLIATIATAWLVVTFVSRLIRNPFLRSVVRWGAWIYVTLYFLDILDPAADTLDGLALELGDFRLSILGLLKALAVVGVLFAIARGVSKTTENRLKNNENVSPSMQVLVIKFTQVVLYGAAFVIGLNAVGFDLTGLAVLSGAIGVGLGFGLQKVVSNLVSGIIILLDKSIKPGDVISLGDTFGWINALGARYVSVVTRNGKEYLIPNEDLITGQVVNWSHSNDYVRLDIFFGTSYSDSPHEVRRLAIEAARGVDRVLSFKPPVCHIVGFGDSSVDYILRFWISDPTGGLTNIRGGVYLALWDAFQENGISIPFPQREVRMLGDGGGLDADTSDISAKVED